MLRLQGMGNLDDALAAEKNRIAAAKRYAQQASSDRAAEQAKWTAQLVALIRDAHGRLQHLRPDDLEVIRKGRWLEKPDYVIGATSRKPTGFVIEHSEPVWLLRTWTVQDGSEYGTAYNIVLHRDGRTSMVLRNGVSLEPAAQREGAHRLAGRSDIEPSAMTVFRRDDIQPFELEARTQDAFVEWKEQIVKTLLRYGA
jgi:hypothetical protein